MFSYDFYGLYRVWVRKEEDKPEERTGITFMENKLILFIMS